MKLLNLKIRQFDIWIANLNPQKGTEAGKVRPVLVIQTDMLNKMPYPSTIVCPLTSNVLSNFGVLRTHLKKNEIGLKNDSDILLDQIRAIDNKRFVEKIGRLPKELESTVKRNIGHILDLE